MPSRREFLAAATAAAAGLRTATAAPADKISLAAWSINRSFFRNQRWKNIELPKICREQLGIEGLEFVNQFFELPTMGSLRKVKKQGEDNGVAFVRIMVDDEGPMAAIDKAERMQAAVAHRKWIDIAHYLGCKDIRCNVYGGPQDWTQDADFAKRAAESFNDLLDYSKGSGLDLCIENHGRSSSNADMLLAVMKAVNNPRLGTLPDFGNINKGDDRYEVIRRLLPYAKGISVKAAWRDGDTHPGWDLEKLIQICREAGFHGWWGIESSYRGSKREEEITPDELWENELKGIRLTKRVIERTVFEKT
ncbi:MAG: sugar phosphate isomerase/epimerase family protein [Acidobacteriota bacterium]